jgi:hypothetical protein
MSFTIGLPNQNVPLEQTGLQLQKLITGFIQGPGASGNTGTGSTSPTPTPTAPTSAALAPWLKALGYVSDGDVIQAPMWNNLVTSIMLLATALDVQPPQQDETISVWPVLLPTGDASALGAGETELPFEQNVHGAVGLKGATAKQVFCGWLPLDLPDGFSIVALKLFGARPDPMSRWTVSVLRQTLGQTTFEPVITTDIAKVTRAADHSFTTDQIPVSQLGRTADQLTKLTLVDNDQYRYLFQTQALATTDPEEIELRLVQVICSRA